ncbi:MAG: hypothetical protein Q7S55_02260 [Nanoarchaeota archaeon]|nr:hypothetical protein [Nanoarchaeota archaeon]
MDILNKVTTENRLNCYRREWLKFVDALREGSIDRMFARHEPVYVKEPVMQPTVFEFLLKEKGMKQADYHLYGTGVYGYHDERTLLPESACQELSEMVKVIEHIAQQRNIPIFEGSYYSGDWDEERWTESFAISDYFEDTSGERTKRILDGWITAVKDFPNTTPIISHFDWLNYVDTRPLHEIGEVVSAMHGCYSFSAAHNNLELRFFGTTVPTAKILLGKEIQMPLSENEVPVVKEVILKELDPLRKLGYSIVERDSGM